MDKPDDEIQNEKIPSKQSLGVSFLPCLPSSTIYHFGPIKTLNLWNSGQLDCSKDDNVIYFITSSTFLGHHTPPLNFHHALKCKFIIERPSNPIGFTTKQECLETMQKLREWAELEELTPNQIAEIKGIGFDDALKCRWMINNPESTERCLASILKRRESIGLQFTQLELNQLVEPRYTEPPTIPALRDNSWNIALCKTNEFGQYSILKAWLDHWLNMNTLDS